MRPPFPGMDPWLEHPDLWPDVHNSLITAIRDELDAERRCRAISCGVESRTTVLTGLDVDRIYRPDVAIHTANATGSSSGTGVAVARTARWSKPFQVIVSVDDDEIEETFLTIQELPGRKLVTVIEVLSPTNKKTKDARAEYLEKRRELDPDPGLILSRSICCGRATPMPVDIDRLRSDYRILICRPRAGEECRTLRVFVHDADPADLRSLCCPGMPSRSST